MGRSEQEPRYQQQMSDAEAEARVSPSDVSPSMQQFALSETIPTPLMTPWEQPHAQPPYSNHQHRGENSISAPTHEQPITLFVAQPHTQHSELDAQHMPEEYATVPVPELEDASTAQPDMPYTTTMLDKDTIQALPDLTADTLCDAEVARLAKLSHAAVEPLIASAHQGDTNAREAVIISCLPYALGVARFLYHGRRPQHDDLLDLAQVASERMVERLDRALATSDPAAYLRGIARRAMMDYCTYHTDLIQKPEYSLSLLEKYTPQQTSTVSLDAPLYRKGKRILPDHIAAQQSEPEHDAEKEQNRWTPLYQAVNALPHDQQTALIRLHGLFGQPAETPADIGRPELIRSRAYEARKKLKKVLSQRMYTDKPNGNT